MDVGDKIKQLRKIKNLSQKQVAMELGMDQPQYSRIENGRVEPTITSLKKIAKVFDISLSELVKEDGDLNEEINMPLLEKVKLIEQLDENEKNSILTIIDMAISKKRFKDNLSKLLAS